jgi:hypothetical protein
MVFFARIFFFFSYPNIGTQLGLTHVFHSSSILSHSGWWRWRGGRGEEVEWRQGEDGNDDLSPSSLLFFACQVPERTCKKKTNLLTDQKHLPTEKYFFSFCSMQFYCWYPKPTSQGPDPNRKYWNLHFLTEIIKS